MLVWADGKAQLYRYKIEYTEQIDPESEKEQKVVEYTFSDEIKDKILERLGDKVQSCEAVDQTGNEWIDGMAFDTYDEAVKALEMGEEAYRQYLNENDTELQIMLALTEIYELLIGG